MEITSVAAGLDVLALRTPTLPPATATNTSLVGRKRVWVVDPATPFEAERSILLKAVEQAQDRGRELAGIVLTHHHPDHVGGARWLRDQTGMRIWAHARTAALLKADGFVDEFLSEGDVLVGSDTADDRWTVLHTPGHASGHIVLWEPQRRLMVAGDMVAAVGTIVVDPPDGHMTTYIQQLRRLRALEPTLLVPAHGPAIEAACEKLDFYVKHRLGREAKVLAAVASPSQGPDSGLMGITARAYTDVPKAIHPLAARAALAHLVKLEEDGLVHRQGAPEVGAASLTPPLALAQLLTWTAIEASG